MIFLLELWTRTTVFSSGRHSNQCKNQAARADATEPGLFKRAGILHPARQCDRDNCSVLNDSSPLSTWQQLVLRKWLHISQWTEATMRRGGYVSFPALCLALSHACLWRAHVPQETVKTIKKNTAWCGGTHVNLAPRGSTQDRFQGQWDLLLNPFLFPFSFSHLSSLFPRSAMWSSLTSSSPCILIGKGLPGIASLSSEIRCVPWHTCLQRYFHEYVPE